MISGTWFGLSSRPKPTAAGEVSACRMRCASAGGSAASSVAIRLAPAASWRSAGESTVIWKIVASDRRPAGALVAQERHEAVEQRAVVRLKPSGAVCASTCCLNVFVAAGSAQ